MSFRRSRQSSRIPQLVHFNVSSGMAFLQRPKLLLATDAILAGLIVIFPFIMGGREAWGHRTLITLALALGCVWSLYKVQSGGRLRLLTLEPLIVAGLLLVWFQTVPLAPAVLAKVSPEYKRLLPGWTATQLPSEGQAAVGAWRTTSLVPSETQHAFLMLLSYGVIAIVVAQRLATEEDCQRMLKLIGISGILMAVFAVIQLATSNDRFFWFYRQPYTGTREILKGAFTNRNHFAQFLALSIGPLVWWLMAERSDKTPGVRQLKGLGPARASHSRFDNIVDIKMLLMVCAVGGVVVTIMLSLSRGGMVAATLASTVCLAGLWKSGRVGASLAVAILGVGGIVVAGIIVLGQGKIEDRIDQLASADADRIDGANARRAIWTADLDAIKEFPLMGCGVGSHRYVYPVYMRNFVDFRGVIFSHAESSYVHLATETGLAGLALIALGLLYVVGRITWHILKRTETERVAALAAVLAGLVAGLFHAAVDFIWYAPAIVVITIVLGVTGLRLCTGFRPELGIPFPRIGWLIAGIGCLLVLCRVQPDLERRVTGERWWNQYKNTSSDLETSRIAAMESSETDAAESDSETTEVPAAEPPSSEVAQYDVPDKAEIGDDELKGLSARISLLLKGIKANPQHLDAVHELSLLSLKMFQLRQRVSDNPLSEVQIRDAALSNFKSTGEMHAWLKKAFGRNIKLLMLSDQMARHTLALCPVNGEAYMVLLHTSFLRDVRDFGRESLINQTMLVGSNDPYVRYFVGDCLLTEGKVDAALEQWQFVFHSSPEYRRQVCLNISRQLPADFVLTTFKPSIAELDEVLSAFQERGRKTDIEKLLYVIEEATRRAATASESRTASAESEQLQDTSQRVNLLMAGHQAAYAFELHEQSEHLLRLALACDETAYWPHHALGLLLLSQERFTEAGEMLEWCFEQNPGDNKVEELLIETRSRAHRKRTRVHPASHEEQKTERL